MFQFKVWNLTEVSVVTSYYNIGCGIQKHCIESKTPQELNKTISSEDVKVVGFVDAKEVSALRLSEKHFM